MTTDINDLVTIMRDVNGPIRITNDKTNKENIYRLLRDMGFGKSSLDGIAIYFRRLAGTIKVITFGEMKRIFGELLEEGDFINLPTDVYMEQIINWYRLNTPLKPNEVLDEYLISSLTQEEAGILHSSIDKSYKHLFAVRQLLLKLREWNFHKTTDNIGTFFKNCPLYYKSIGGTQFLIFSHQSSKHNTFDTYDTFDCWIADYQSEKNIGNETALNIQKVKMGFEMENDMPLIQQYLNEVNVIVAQVAF